MLNLLKLENRIVLDGAGIAEAVEHHADIHDTGVAGPHDGHDGHVPDHSQDNDAHHVAEAAALLGQSHDNNQPLDIVLVSDNLPDTQALTEAVKPGAKVIVYDANGESAQQVINEVIAVAHQEGREINSLTILSHGGSGFFKLGNEMITAQNLEDHADVLTALNDAMSDDGNIYVYGCGVANNSQAAHDLINGLAHATGTTVFASDDITGNGGDWDLEIASHDDISHHDPNPPLDMHALSHYDGTLTTSLPLEIATLEDHPGSYRIFIYGPGESQGSQDAGSVTLTNYDSNVFTNVRIHYDGWITNEPREIDGVMVNEYHRWSVDYDPHKDINQNTVPGKTTIDFNVRDAGNMSTNVTLIPVNDAPEFMKGPDQTIPEDSGMQTVFGWATGIRPGPVTAVDEVGQHLNFTITNDNNSLFSTQPTVDPNTGNLVYTPAPNAYGVAHVTLTLHDDGGTDFGGVDTSAPQTFTITITPQNDSPDAPIVGQMEYVENHDPTHLNVTLGNDIDDTHLSRAEIHFGNGYKPGEDVLNYTPVNGINGSWNSSTGTLTLTGTATIAQYQQAIRSVTYGNPANDNPTQGFRNVEVTIWDNNSTHDPNGPASSTGNGQLWVDAINDQPDLGPEHRDTITYDEGSQPVIIDHAFDLSDVDDGYFHQATIQIEGGFHPGEDRLVFQNTGNITGQYNPATGTLTLTAVSDSGATLENFRAALDSVKYWNSTDGVNANPNPTEGTRTIRFTIEDANSSVMENGVLVEKGYREPMGTSVNPNIGGPMTDAVIREIFVDSSPNIDNLAHITGWEDDQAPPHVEPAPPGVDFEARPNEGMNVHDLITSSDGTDAMAITNVDNSHGTWQYFINNGGDPANDANWHNIDDGSLSDAHALLLGPNDRIRFEPNKDFNTERPFDNTIPTYNARGWDGTGGTQGQYVNTNIGGSVFGDHVTGDAVVFAVNDKPIINNVPDTEQTADSTGGLVVNGIFNSDIDVGEGNNTLRMTLYTGNDNTHISLGQTNGLTFIEGDGTNDHRMEFTGNIADVNAAIRSITYQAPNNTDSPIINDTITLVTNDVGDHIDNTGNFGAPGPRSDMAVINIHVPNGPSVGTDTFTYIEDCASVPIATHITDADSASLQSLEVRIDNVQDMDVLHFDTSGTNITGHYENGVLTFTGIDSVDHYNDVLTRVRFENLSDNPATVQRTIHITGTDAEGNNGPTATSIVNVVPVNDAPVNNIPLNVGTTQNEPIVFHNISVNDPDVGDGVIVAHVRADFGTVTVTASNTGATINNNGGSNIAITGTLSQVNAALDGLTYRPLTDFNGNDHLNITVNDQGHTGVHPDNNVNKDNCSLIGVQLDDNGQVPHFPNEGTEQDPTAMTDTDTIAITVTESNVHVVPVEPGTPEVPILPITRPSGDNLGGVSLGAISLPGPVGITGGHGNPLSGFRSLAGKESMEFCSIEEALRSHLGCRFANTTDPQAKFSSVEWSDLGQPRPYLDEEYDLYSQLFIREDGDPGFNVEPGFFPHDMGGLPDVKQDVFENAGDTPTFNDLGPGEIKAAFFKGREELDKTGR